MYLLTFNINGTLILAASVDNGIQGYHTIKEGLDDFKGFTSKFGSGDYESYTSAGIGMMNLMPKLVEDEGNINDIAPFILDTKINEWSGMMGVLTPIRGVRLDPKFLEGKHIISIWKESMMAAGIAD